MKASLAIAASLAAVSVGCVQYGETPGRTTSGNDLGAPIGPNTHALLEVHALDLWARPLPIDQSWFSVTRDGEPVEWTGWPVVTVQLDAPGDYDIELGAADHETVHATVTYDGTEDFYGAGIWTWTDSWDSGVSFAHVWRDVGGGRWLPAHATYVGLRHRWFAPTGRAPTSGNDIELLMDGEEAWGRVHGDLVAAENEIDISTWWWDSGFELVRDWDTSPYLSDAARWNNTILGTLAASGAYKRVLVGQLLDQDGWFSGVSKDAALHGYATAAYDGFEVMGQANPTDGAFWFEIPSFLFGNRVLDSDYDAWDSTFEPEYYVDSRVEPRLVDLSQWPIPIAADIASWHQKFIVIDGGLAYVGGMNLQFVDWDSSEHIVFDPRRMPYDADLDDRVDIVNYAAVPDLAPRKDYMMRIAGPASADVADVFRKRWNAVRAAGTEYAGAASDFTPAPGGAPVDGGVTLQVVATMPAPFSENAIAETWLAAIANATKFIYIEDQYFRMPMINDAIAARMWAVPALKLIVITDPVSEWTSPGCAWTHRSDTFFETNFPTRYMTLQLRAFEAISYGGVAGWGDDTDGYFEDIYIHSKMLIIDDRYMSVGSCNKNNRGLVYEGEMSVAVLDEDFVKASRRRILANLLGDWAAPTDDVSVWWQQLAQAAAYNDWVRANWDATGDDLNLNGAPLPDGYVPVGFVYGLEFGSLSDCVFETVGPDMT